MRNVCVCIHALAYEVWTQNVFMICFLPPHHTENTFQNSPTLEKECFTLPLFMLWSDIRRTDLDSYRWFST